MEIKIREIADRPLKDYIGIYENLIAAGENKEQALLAAFSTRHFITNPDVRYAIVAELKRIGMGKMEFTDALKTQGLKERAYEISRGSGRRPDASEVTMIYKVLPNIKLPHDLAMLPRYVPVPMTLNPKRLPISIHIPLVMPARTRAHALIRFTDALRKRVNEMGLTLVEAMDRFVASGGGRTSFLLYWEGKEPPKYNKSFNRLSVAFGVDFRPYLEYNKSTRGLIARRPRFDA